MKNFLLLFVLLISLAGCKDGPKETDTKNETDIGTEVTDTSSRGLNGEILEETATEKDGVQTTDKEEPAMETSAVPLSLEGTYKRLSEENQTPGCNCSCFEISFSTPTELCISADQIYITAKFEKSGENKADLYLSEVVRSEVPDQEIPWEDFDRDTPIATVTRNPDGSLSLDWLGFKIGGEIAVDYAIYGKKTLEGDYRKE